MRFLLTFSLVAVCTHAISLKRLGALVLPTASLCSPNPNQSCNLRQPNFPLNSYSLSSTLQFPNSPSHIPNLYTPPNLQRPLLHHSPPAITHHDNFPIIPLSETSTHFNILENQTPNPTPSLANKNTINPPSPPSSNEQIAQLQPDILPPSNEPPPKPPQKQSPPQTQLKNVPIMNKLDLALNQLNSIEQQFNSIKTALPLDSQKKTWRKTPKEAQLIKKLAHDSQILTRNINNLLQQKSDDFKETVQVITELTEQIKKIVQTAMKQNTFSSTLQVHMQMFWNAINAFVFSLIVLGGAVAVYSKPIIDQVQQIITTTTSNIDTFFATLDQAKTTIISPMGLAIAGTALTSLIAWKMYPRRIPINSKIEPSVHSLHYAPDPVLSSTPVIDS